MLKRSFITNVQFTSKEVLDTILPIMIGKIETTTLYSSKSAAVADDLEKKYQVIVII